MSSKDVQHSSARRAAVPDSTSSPAVTRKHGDGTPFGVFARGVISSIIELFARSVRGMCGPIIECFISIGKGEMPDALRLWGGARHGGSAVQHHNATQNELEEDEHPAMRDLLSEFIAEISTDIDQRLDFALSTIQEVTGNAVERMSASSHASTSCESGDDAHAEERGVFTSVVSLRALQTHMSDVISEIEDLVRQHRNAEADHHEPDDAEEDLATSIRGQVQALKDVSFAVETSLGETQGDDGSPVSDFAPITVIEHACAALSTRARSAGIEVYGSVDRDMPACVRGDESANKRLMYLVLNATFRCVDPGALELFLTVDRIQDEYVFATLSLNHPRAALSTELLQHLVTIVNAEQACAHQLPTLQHDAIPLFWIARQAALHHGSRLQVTAEPDGGMTIDLRLRWHITPSSPSQRRANNRLRLEMVASNHGPVIDLSRSGARIRSSQLLQGEIDIEIRDAETNVLVPCKVCWSKQRGWRKYDIGLQFLEVTAESARRLIDITMRNRLARSMGES